MRSVLELEFKFTVNIYGWSWEGRPNAVTGVDEITDFVLTHYGLCCRRGTCAHVGVEFMIMIGLAFFRRRLLRVYSL